MATCRMLRAVGRVAVTLGAAGSAACTDLPVTTEGRVPLTLQLQIPEQIVTLDTTLLTVEARDPWGNLVASAPLVWDLEVEGATGAATLIRSAQDSVWVVGGFPGTWGVEVSVNPGNRFFTGGTLTRQVEVGYRGLAPRFVGVGPDTLLESRGEFLVGTEIVDYRGRTPLHGDATLTSLRGLIRIWSPLPGYNLFADAAGVDTLVLSHTTCAPGCADTLVVTIEPVATQLNAWVRGASYLNHPILLVTDVWDAKGHPLEEAERRWSLVDPTDSTVLRITDPTGWVVPVSNGVAAVTVSVGDLEETFDFVVQQELSYLQWGHLPQLLVGGMRDTILVDAQDAGGTPLADEILWNAIWSSSDPAAVRVVESTHRRGVLEALGVGEAEISMQIEACGPIGGCLLDVRPHPIRVIPEPDSVRIVTEYDTTIQAIGPTGVYFFGDVFLTGETIPRAELFWTSLDPGVATVDDNGQVIAHAVGTAELVGRMGMAADTVTVTILP